VKPQGAKKQPVFSGNNHAATPGAITAFSIRCQPVLNLAHLIIGYPACRIDIIFFEVYIKSQAKVLRIFNMSILQQNVCTKMRLVQNFSFKEAISVCPASLDLIGKNAPLTIFPKPIPKPARVLKLALMLGFIVFFLCESPVVLQAQTERIVSVSQILVPVGRRLTLIRGSYIRLSYDSSTMPVESVILRDVDIVQTAAGVFAEIRVTPGNALIRLAENTMLSFDKISGLAEPMAITLMYGRIRIDQTSKTETIIIKAGASIVELQSGSVNFDYIVSPSLKYKSQPVLSVSTISGRAVVIPPGTKQREINMRQKKTLTIDPQNGKTKRRSMGKEVPAYWLRVSAKVL
jgi:hypothetical protein